MTPKPETLVAAARAADTCGLVFIHEADDGPPSYVILTDDRYRALTERIFDKEIPVDDPEWEHEHITPEMIEHAKEQTAPAMVKDGVRYRVVHERPVVGWRSINGIPRQTFAQMGGWTTVEILGEDDEVLAVGQALCRPDEMFCRWLGREIALGRAKLELNGERVRRLTAAKARAQAAVK